MKHIFSLSIFLFLLSFQAFAQDENLPVPPTAAPVAADAIRQGNWIVGGSIASTGFNFSTDTYNLTINPKGGYFIGDNVAIGTEFILGLDAYDGGTNFQYGITPFGRYYFPEGSRPTGRFFQEVAIGIAGSSLADNEEDEAVSFLAALRLGYAHFVARNVAAEGILGYTYSQADIDTDTGSSGLAISLGFQIYLIGRENR